MMASHYVLFDTAVGVCALAWRDGALIGVQLPEADRAATERRVRRRHPEAEEADAPPELAGLIADIVALTEGFKIDLSATPLPMDSQPDLHRRVYEIALTIQPGQVMTYGEIARQLGDVSLSRAVGQALGANPWPIVVPCHRVLAADGRTGGFSAPGGVDTKLRLLTIERAATTDAPMLFDALPLEARPRRR